MPVVSLLSGDWMLVVSPVLVIEEQMMMMMRRAVWSSFAVCSTFFPCIIMIILRRENQTMSERRNSHNEEEAEKRSAWCPSFPSLISWILPPVSLLSSAFSVYIMCCFPPLFSWEIVLMQMHLWIKIFAYSQDFECTKRGKLSIVLSPRKVVQFHNNALSNVYSTGCASVHKTL